MSISLVKKSLDLLANETEVRCAKRNLISQTGSKSKKLKRKHIVDEKQNAALLVQRIREKSKSDTNKVDVNVQRLLNLSQANTIHQKLENKLLDQVTRKRKAECDLPGKQKSAFTEEDFEKFEKEYFAN